MKDDLERRTSVRVPGVRFSSVTDNPFHPLNSPLDCRPVAITRIRTSYRRHKTRRLPASVNARIAPGRNQLRTSRPIVLITNHSDNTLSSGPH